MSERVAAPRRTAALGGAAAVGAALLLAGAGAWAFTPTLLLVVLAQLLLGPAWLAALDTPSSPVALLVLGGVCAAADASVGVRDDGRVGVLAGVIGVAVGPTLLHQLARRHRTEVTGSIAAVVGGAVLLALLALPLALRQLPGGSAALTAAAVGLAAALATLDAGRLVLPAGRGIGVGVGGVAVCLLAVGVAAGVGTACGVAAAALTGGQGAALGAVSGAAGTAAAVLVERATPDLRRDARRRLALVPLAVVLPLAAAAPAAYAVGRLLLA